MSTAGGRITASAGSNLIGAHAADRNQEATCYVGNIDPQANEELIWELCVQAGPVGKCWQQSGRRLGGQAVGRGLAGRGQSGRRSGRGQGRSCFWAVCWSSRSWPKLLMHALLLFLDIY